MNLSSLTAEYFEPVLDRRTVKLAEPDAYWLGHFLIRRVFEQESYGAKIKGLVPTVRR